MYEAVAKLSVANICASQLLLSRACGRGTQSESEDTGRVPIRVTYASNPIQRCFQSESPSRAQVSPLHRIAQIGASAAALLPPGTLFHGTADATVPAAQSARMADAWTAAGARLSLVR